MRRECIFVMKTLLSFVLLGLSVSGCDISFSTDAQKSSLTLTEGTEAQRGEVFEAAKDIVHRIDSGDYEQVWENASPLLKNLSAKFVFTNFLSLTRKNLGDPSPRGMPIIGFTEVIHERYPKGEYSILEVGTVFGKKTIQERVTMIKEAGVWKLVGYELGVSSQ